MVMAMCVCVCLALCVCLSVCLSVVVHREEAIRASGPESDIGVHGWAAHATTLHSRGEAASAGDDHEKRSSSSA